MNNLNGRMMRRMWEKYQEGVKGYPWHLNNLKDIPVWVASKHVHNWNISDELPTEKHLKTVTTA